MANSEPKVLLADLDIDKLLDKLMADDTINPEPMSDEEWAEFVDGMAKHYGMSDEEKQRYLK